MEQIIHTGRDYLGVAVNGNGHAAGHLDPSEADWAEDPAQENSDQPGTSLADLLERALFREEEHDRDQHSEQRDRFGSDDTEAARGASPDRIRRRSRSGYERLVDRGILQPGERLEVVGGDMVLRERQGDQHALAIELGAEALRTALGQGWRVRVRLPVMLDEESEPEPDFSIVHGTPREAAGRSTRSRPALLMEVAESSLSFDRSEKGSLYARAGIADYWILNIKDRVLEVYREPRPAPEAPFGWRYTSVRSLGPGAVISPLAAPQAHVVVAYLLP